MKQKIIILSLVLISFFSCEDFFNPIQKGNIPATEFYSELNNLRLGLNSVYNVLQSQDYQLSELIFGEAISDNCWNIQDVEVTPIGQLLNFQFDTNNPYISTRYSVNYNAINKCNQIIRSIPYIKYRPNGGSEREIREVYGQAKFLRALLYFNMVKTFGGVSIMPENQSLDSLIVRRSTLDESYAYIEKDLRESLLILFRGRYQDVNAGQAGIGAALSLLLKVLVYEASPGVKFQTTDHAVKWQEALEIGQFFLEGKDLTYNKLLKFDTRYTESWNDFSKRLFLDSLITKETNFPGQQVVNIHQLDKFDKIFRVTGEFSPESLFEINHFSYSTAGVSGEEGWLLDACITNNSGGGTISVTPSSDLNDQFANDPRQIYTITGRTYNDYYKQETSTPAIGWFGTGNSLLFTKYYVFPSEGTPKVRNYRVMRFAETILLYAEVLNETGNTRKSVDYVNLIRQRARKLLDPTNPNEVYNSAISSTNFKDLEYAPFDVVRAAIRKEKRIEMACEFDRWFEICRLGIVADRMAFIANNSPAEPSGQIRVRGKYFKKGVNEIFPIPQNEVLISNGVIKQNFGY
jgi:starch-binding outer membrane protein, SusD/RagB family